MIVRSIKLTVVLLASVMGLTACAGIQQHPSAWPDGLSARQHFNRLYLADDFNRALQTEEQYMTWVIRFYKGWAIYPLGWKDIEVDVIEGIEDKRHSIVKAKLRSLGQLISGDWAKHNNVRHITTAMLALWGEVIQAAVEFDKGEATVDQVTADVLDLLSGNLSPKAIELGRYQTKLGLSLREPLIYFE